MAERVLIVSPIPSHPQDQGNSARIYVVGRLLQSAGLIVHFLYYQMEGLLPAQLAEMQTCWDYVHLVPCPPRSMAPTGVMCYNLDDWADPMVNEAAADLHCRFRFRSVITNYVWFSQVLQTFDGNVLKVLDTHDVFGGRDKRFREAGLMPEWYYTTEAEETRGLARADVVLAIQDEEAAYFRSLGHPDVRVVGHMPGRRQGTRRTTSDRRVTVGYLASGNPLNISSFEAMRRRLTGRPTRSALAFLVAGSICDQLRTATDPFVVLGRLKYTDDFYDRVDVVVNPMAVGTGLKIKSVEAIFDGIPLLATTAAMNGLPARHRLHALRDPDELADCLVSESFNEALMCELATASRSCAECYAAEVSAAILSLVHSIVARDSCSPERC